MPKDIPSSATARQELQYAINNESREPLFVASESKVGLNSYLHIPREHLPDSAKGEVLEARLARLSLPKREFRLYTCSNFKDPHIYVSPLNPTRHERFHVMSLSPYEISDFVRDFNLHKPDEFANVTLSCSGGRVMVLVDSCEVDLTQAKLTSDGSRAILHGALAGDATRFSIRVAKQFESYRLTFARFHARITHMRGIGETIEANYKMSSREPYSHVREIPAKSVHQRDGSDSLHSAGCRLLGLDKSSMSRRELRAWIDTEGS